MPVLASAVITNSANMSQFIEVEGYTPLLANVVIAYSGNMSQFLEIAGYIGRWAGLRVDATSLILAWGRVTSIH